MELENVVIDLLPCSNVLPADVTSSSTCRTDDSTRKCPLCQSTVRLFFINFNEKFLMCENTECDFPFGYEELQFVTIDNDMAIAEVCTTNQDSVRTHHMASTISNSGLSEIEHINRMYQVDECDTNLNDPDEKDPNDKNHITNADRGLQKKLKRENDKKIQKHLEDIDNLHKELMACKYPKESEDVPIRNEKFIRKLKSLQELTGVQLLKPSEVKLLEKEEPDIGLGELKIDIDPGDINCISTIKIAIQNSQTENLDKE